MNEGGLVLGFIVFLITVGAWFIFVVKGSAKMWFEEKLKYEKERYKMMDKLGLIEEEKWEDEDS